MYIHYETQKIVKLNKPYTTANGTIHFKTNISDSELAVYGIYPMVEQNGNVASTTYELIDSIVYRTIPNVVIDTSVSVVTPRQFRLALLATGTDPDSIRQLIIDNVSDPIQQKATLLEWEYASNLKRDNALIGQFAVLMNKTEQDLDALFSLAATFE